LFARKLVFVEEIERMKVRVLGMMEENSILI
jgi:hypothetical protein